MAISEPRMFSNQSQYQDAMPETNDDVSNQEENLEEAEMTSEDVDDVSENIAQEEAEENMDLPEAHLNVQPRVAADVASMKRGFVEVDNELQQISMSVKRRKALQSLNSSNSRLNVLQNAFVDPTIVTRAQQTAHVDSPTSSVRASRKVSKNWPRIQDSKTFTRATIGEQRMELTNHMNDLQEYTSMIQAGAVPTAFVLKFFERLETHFLRMDSTLDQVETLHRREALRKAQLSILLQECNDDHKDAQVMLSEFELPGSRDAEE